MSKKLIQLDPEDEHLRVFCYVKPNGYAVHTKLGVTTYLHRFLLGDPEGRIVDHINRDKLDNRKENLRACTPSQSSCNTGLRATSKSGYKGVSWSARDRRWQVRLTIEGKAKSLGSFTQLRAAVIAYNEAAIRYHKEFAFVQAVPSL